MTDVQDALDLARGVVRRVDFGYFVRPSTETETGLPRVEPLLGYVVRAGDAVLLVDTGMGSHPEVDAHYRPRRRSLPEALAPLGIAAGRRDPRGELPPPLRPLRWEPRAGRAAGVRQRTEIAAARTTAGLHAAGAARRVGVRGARRRGRDRARGSRRADARAYRGHQSFVVRLADGSVVVAGQSHDTTTAYAGDVLALRAHRDGHPPPLPEPRGAWVARIQELDPRMVVLAHDHSVWVP